MIDLEWKVLYVGSAEDSRYDQVLEELCVGPVPVGMNRFVLQAPAPDPAMIKNEDLLGVTVVLVTCSYYGQEFVRIGYFVNNEYSDPYDPETPPNPVDINKLFRNIKSDEARVTRFAIDWSGKAPTVPIEAGPEEDIPVDESEEVVDFDRMDGDDEESDDDDEEEEMDVNAEVDLDDDEGDEDEEIDTGDQSDPAVDAVITMNEDSMDVAMMQQYVDHASTLSNQGVF